MYFTRDPANQGDFYPWGSITAVTILSYICPSSRLNADYGTTFGAGTWFISFVAGSAYSRFSFGAAWESLAGGTRRERSTLI